jgi:hypothetical protein
MPSQNQTPANINYKLPPRPGTRQQSGANVVPANAKVNVSY